MDMDIQRFFLPYWELEGWTDLSHEQIGQCLLANVATGFSLYNPRLYYGNFSPQGFSVRRAYSRLKKASTAPTVSGQYGVRDGAMWVALRVTPHPLWLGLFLFFFVGGGLVWLPGLATEAFQTWNPSVLVGGLLPLAVIYGVGWLLFRLFCNTDLRFWQQALRVREVSPRRDNERHTATAPLTRSLPKPSTRERRAGQIVPALGEDRGKVRA